MNKKINRKTNSKYMFLGILAGLLFPLIAILLELLRNNLSISGQNIRQIHIESPVIFIIYAAPFVLGYAAWYLGKIIIEKSSLMKKNEDDRLLKAKKIYDFTEKLSNGDTEVEYEFDHDIETEDSIGQSLEKLRDYLKKNKLEEELRRKAEQQQNWVNQGMARFGDILRQNNNSINELSYNIISNLVNYVEAVQGGMFIINDNDPNDKHIELAACYAYSRKKFLEKRIEWEEGLIGACTLEKDTILLTDVPQDYVTITSGLGETRPDCIILVPLKVNEVVHGVIELAALKVFQKFEIDFLEKLAESIASVLSSVKINMQTAHLLKESQEQGKILAVQEDEMRRNMEELSFAKEEAAKQGELLASFTNTVNHTLVRAEYSPEGILLYANTRFLNKLGYSSNKDVEGKHISSLISDKDKEWFFQIWDKLAKGGKHFEGDMKYITKNGKDFWSTATFTCVRNYDGSVEKILFLGIDTTKQKKKNLDYEAQINAISKNNLKIEYNPDGSILEANEKFLEISEIPASMLDNYSVFSFADQVSGRELKDHWKNIIKGTTYETQFKYRTASEQEIWIDGTYIPTTGIYGEISKIIFLGRDITHKKTAEFENQKQTLLFNEMQKSFLIQQEDVKIKHGEFKDKVQQHNENKRYEKVKNDLTIESAANAIVAINQDEKIELFNKAAEKLWETDRREVLGKHIRDILPPPYNYLDDGDVIEFLKSDKNHLKGNRTEVNIINKIGKKVPVFVTLSEVKIDNSYTYAAFIQNI